MTQLLPSTHHHQRISIIVITILYWEMLPLGPLLPHTVDDRLHWNWTDNVSRGGLFTRIVSQCLADRALLSCQLLCSECPDSRMHLCFYTLSASLLGPGTTVFRFQPNVTVQSCLETSCPLLFLFLHSGTLTLQYETQNSPKYSTHEASIQQSFSNITQA